MRTTRRAGRAAVEDEGTRVLCVLVRCNALVLAIPAGDVVRILLADEVETRMVDGHLRARAADHDVPAWHLAPLLGLELTTVSWLIVAPAAGGCPPIALGTGPCMAVRPLPPPVPLPRGLFRSHHDGVRGGFRTDEALRARGAGVLGLWLDPIGMIGAPAIAEVTAPSQELL